LSLKKIKNFGKDKEVLNRWSHYMFIASFIIIVIMFFNIFLWVEHNPLFNILSVALFITYFLGGMLFILTITLTVYKKLKK